MPSPIPAKASVDVVDDGYLKGHINPRAAGDCQNCGKHVRCIHITELNLPPGMEPSAKFIFYGEDKIGDVFHHTMIGISCGCYGKGMRQIAYVLAKRSARKK
jgi:hypothetical protein